MKVRSAKCLLPGIRAVDQETFPEVSGGRVWCTRTMVCTWCDRVAHTLTRPSLRAHVACVAFTSAFGRSRGSGTGTALRIRACACYGGYVTGMHAPSTLHVDHARMVRTTHHLPGVAGVGIARQVDRTRPMETVSAVRVTQLEQAKSKVKSRRMHAGALVQRLVSTLRDDSDADSRFSHAGDDSSDVGEPSPVRAPTEPGQHDATTGASSSSPHAVGKVFLFLGLGASRAG